MKRRSFFEKSLAVGGGLAVTSVITGFSSKENATESKDLSGITNEQHFDVIVVGGGTAGVLAAIAA